MFKKFFPLLIFYVLVYDNNCNLVGKYFTDHMYVDSYKKYWILSSPLVFNVKVSGDTYKAFNGKYKINITDDIHHIKLTTKKGYEALMMNGKGFLYEVDKTVCQGQI